MQLVPTLATPIDLTPFERAVDQLELSAPAPVVVQRVLALLARDASWRELALALAVDAGLVARIVRLASSPAFAARPIRDITAALQMLGVDQLRRVVVTAQLAGRSTAFSRALLAYSLRVAFTCQSLARSRHGPPGPDPFLCGLLHDLGTMAFEVIAGPSYAAMAFVPGDDRQGPLERERFGFDHADLGAMVAARWNLFPELELVAQLHHTPEACAVLDLPPPTRIAIETVALARTLIIDVDERTAAVRAHLCAHLCDQLAIEVAGAEACGREGALAADALVADLG